MSQGQTLIRYAPTVCGDSSAVEVFRCLPVYQTASGDEFGVDVVLGHKGDIENTAQRNAAILRLAFKALERAHAQGQSANLILPVNSIALASRAGAAVIYNVFAELDEACRAATIIEIFNLPERVSIDSLSDITIPMLLYTNRFIAHPHAAMEDLTVFANCNYQGVIFDMAKAPEDSQQRLDALTDFWSAATKRRLGLCIQGAADPETLSAAQRWEAMFIDGPAIGAPVDRPGSTATK